MRDGAETQQVQPVSSDGPVALNLPQLDAELGSHEHGFYEEQRTDPQSTSPAPFRRSSRPRCPGQMLTYSSLGYPTYQFRPTINAVDTYLH